MTIINRMSRLFKADIHGLLDALEEPETLAKHAVREMEEAIAAEQSSLDELIDRHKQIERALEIKSEKIEELEQQLNLCFESGNDSLAKKLVRRKLESFGELHQLQESGTHYEQAILAAQKQLSERERQLEHAQEKLNVLVEAASIDSELSSCGLGGKSGVTEDEVEIAFLAEKKKRGSMKSEQEVGV